MPINCDVPIRAYSTEEFGRLHFDVMESMYRIRNELGRFFDERIYKQALKAVRSDVQLEVAVDVVFGLFRKRFLIDAVVANGGIFEFKTVEVIAARHRA